MRYWEVNRIGISGWRYAGWRGVFYPEDLPQKEELHYASRELSSIEINGTFYGLQKPPVFRRWYDDVPEDFVFSVKGSRFITHLRRLKDADEPLANFFASGVLELREKLGPFLWQLPPSLTFDQETVSAFCRRLPQTFAQARKLAGLSEEAEGSRRPIRHAMEVRHRSFMCPEFFGILRRHGVAFVFADTAGKWPYAEDITADFLYLRLHGDEELYASGYTEEAVARWARRIRLWQGGRQPGDARLITPRTEANAGPRDVYVYFDNDMKVKAPRDARRLVELLS